jgi:regulator of replication initiation timing
MTKEQWQQEVALGITELSFELWQADRQVDELITENNVLHEEIKRLKHELHWTKIIG